MAAPDRTDDEYPNHDTEIYVIFAIFTALSSTALILRLMSRRIKRVSYHWDDILVVFAWVVTLAEGVLIAAAPSFCGLGHHSSELTVEQIVRFFKADFALAILQTTALALAKLSVLIQLHRIFITPKFQLIIQILGAIVTGWWISSIFAFSFICVPVRLLWEPDKPHRCENEKILNLIDPLPWILTDFAILIAPIPMVGALQLSWPKKIGIIAVFLTGGFTCIVACIRYSMLFRINSDITWSTANLAAWNVIETNVTVICACIVAIKPALDYLFPKSLISSARATWSKLNSGGSIRVRSRMGSDSYRGASPTLPQYNTLKYGWGASTIGDTGGVRLESIKKCRTPSSSDEPLCE